MDNDMMVTVCCSTYNHVQYIKGTLDSFLMQKTTFPFEIVIFDDCSTDGTIKIIKEYEKKYPNIVKPIYQKKNQFKELFYSDEIWWGYEPLVQFVFPKAKGKYLALCEGDDYWCDPTKLQKQVDFLESNLDYIATYHDSSSIAPDGEIIPCFTHGRDYTQKELIALPSGIATPAKLFRNIYSEDTKKDFNDFCGDALLNCFFGLHGKCKYIPGIKPSMHRIHATGVWARKTPAQQREIYINLYKTLYRLIAAKGIPEFTEIRERSFGKVNYFAIIIPTYRREDGKTLAYLKRALDSVFAQTYKNFRVYLIGDGYTEKEELADIISNYPNEKIYCANLSHSVEREQYKNNEMALWCSGGTAPTNHALDKISVDGLKLVCFLDHDDYWYENHLEELDTLIKEENADWMCTKSFIGELSPTVKYLPEIVTDEKHIKFLPQPSHVIKSSVCFNIETLNARIRDVFKETGSCRPGDADLWERMAYTINKQGLKSFMVNKVTCVHDTERHILGND